MAKRSAPKGFKKLMKHVQNKANAAAIGPGRVLGERYELAEELGRGAFGAVFRATDRQSGQTVAVKVLHEHMVDAQIKERMQREAHAMKQLVDTCAVDVLDFAQTPQGQQYLVMEFLEGRNLEQLFEAYEGSGRHVPLQELGRILRPIVDTLAVAHTRNIIHRDLKPENIFVLSAGGPRSTRLLDFGLVKDLSLEKLTAAGMVAGSPSYIAPESWAGQPDKLDHRIDIFSLGVIVFRGLTGTTPFADCADVLQLMLAVTTKPRPAFRTFRPDLHESADHWLHRALAIKPEERFQTMQDLWDGLSYVALHSPQNA